jgi:hypothetical protein
MTAVDYSAQTTLVTGASSGIGVAFARRLAARGSDLVLVARRQDRLDALADELRAAHGVRVEVIACDLTQPRPGRILADELDRRGVQVTSLVNNAGFGTDGAFLDEDPDRLADLVALNIAAVVDLTRTFLRPLTDAGTGILVNVASMAAYQPIPGMAVYAASKAFVLSLTEALWWETRGSGLRTIALSPGLTRTEFFDVIGTEQYSGSFQTPDEVVDAALRALDRRRPGPSTLTRRANVVATTLTRFLSRRAAVLAAARYSGAERLVRKAPVTTTA